VCVFLRVFFHIVSRLSFFLFCETLSTCIIGFFFLLFSESFFFPPPPCLVLLLCSSLNALLFWLRFCFFKFFLVLSSLNSSTSAFLYLFSVLFSVAFLL